MRFLISLFVSALMLEPALAQSLADDLINAGRAPVVTQKSTPKRPKNNSVRPSKPRSNQNALQEGFVALSEQERRNVQRFLKEIGYYASGIDGKFGSGTRAALISVVDFLEFQRIDTAVKSKTLLEGLLQLKGYIDWSEIDPVETFSRKENLSSAIRIDAENMVKFIEQEGSALPVSTVFSIEELNLFLDQKVGVIAGVSALEKLYNVPIINEKFSDFLLEQQQKILFERQAANSANKDFLKDAREQLSVWIKSNILDPRGPDVLRLLQEVDVVTAPNSSQPLDEIVNRTLALGEELGLAFERPRTQAYLNTLAAMQPDKVLLSEKGGPLSIEMVNEKKELIEFLLLDLEAFLIEGGTGFTFTLAKDVSDVREILGKNWGVLEAELAERFVQKLISNGNFQQFHEYQINNRADEKQRKVSELKSELEPKLSELAQWATLNLLNPRAAEIAQFLSTSQAVVSAEDVEALSTALDKVNEFNSELGINIRTSDSELEFQPNAPNFDADKFYVLANVSGQATNSYVDLNGAFSSINNVLAACYEDFKIDTFTQVELSKSIFENSRNVESISWNEPCEPTTDVRITTGFLLNENPVLVIGETKENVVLTEVSKSDVARAYEKSLVQKELLLDDIRVSARRGFGVLTFNLTGKFFCGLSDESSIDVHKDMMSAAETDLFAHSGHEKLIKNMLSDPEELFILAQRDGCSAVYADSDTLRDLVNGFDLLEKDFDVLPFWISFDAVEAKKQEYDLLEEQQQKKLAENLRSKDNENRIAKNRARELAQLAANKEKVLQRENNTRFTSLVFQQKEYLDQFAADSLAVDQINEILPFSKSLISVDRGDLLEEDLPTLLNIYDKMVDLRKDAWRLVDTEVVKKDYGFVDFEQRKLQAVEFEYSVNLQNRVIGQYKTYCVLFAGVFDEDFRVWRKLMTSECGMEGSTLGWKNVNRFRSAWLVKTEDLEEVE